MKLAFCSKVFQQDKMKQELFGSLAFSNLICTPRGVFSVIRNYLTPEASLLNSHVYGTTEYEIYFDGTLETK